MGPSEEFGTLLNNVQQKISDIKKFTFADMPASLIAQQNF